MNFHLAVSPDFPPDRLAGWYVFNTWLQKTLGIEMRFDAHSSFADQRAAIAADQVDLIYANPYDAATLVREKGFQPLVGPVDMPNEVAVVVSAESSVQGIDDLAPGITVVSADGPDVQRMGMIILEPAEINAQNSTLRTCDSNALVAKELLRGTADVGIFLERAYNGLSNLTRKSLRTLVVSRIHVIEHHLLIGPRLVDRRDALIPLLVGMAGDASGKTILADLGISGWKATAREDLEFLIDLIDTLVD